MNFYQDYANQAKQYAIFPVIRSLEYTTLGLTSEICEMLLAGNGFDSKHFEDEQGDVWWYLAAVCDATDIDFAAICEDLDPDPKVSYEQVVDHLIQGLRLLTGAVKKLIRDDNSVLSSVRTTRIRVGVGVRDIVSAMMELEPKHQRIMTANLNKLESRKRRGVISGDGDNR